MTSLEGRIALVTGAGSGIGAATTRLLAAEGAFVCCADLDPRAATEVANQVGVAARRPAGYHLDVRDEGQWQRLVGEISSTHGRLDMLVNCAGISAGGPLHDTDLAEWRRVFATNTDGAFLATKHGLRAMRATGGVIVHVGSASGLKPAPGAAAYSASKAALAMLVRVAAKECRDAGIDVRVCAVSPAGVRTPMWRAMPFFQELISTTGSESAAFDALEKNGGGRFAEPEDVARVIRFLVSDDAKHITGVDLPVDAGYVL